MSTINIYPELLHGNPPTEFDEEIDGYCEEINEACKGWGTDEDRLIKALGSKDAKTRYLISLRFKEMYGKELKDVMKSETGKRDFGRALTYLSYPADQLDALIVDYCMKGIGANEDVLYPVLCARSNEEMNVLKTAFFDMYEKDMAVVLNDQLSGDFERFIFYLIQADEEKYDPEYHNEEKAQADAEAFYEAGQGKWIGTDERSFFELISKSPPEHLQRINEVYSEKHGISIVKALDKELGRNVENATKFAAGMKLLPYETVAALIKDACSGFGTNEMLLTFTLIRYDEIMDKVNEAHQALYGMSVADRVKKECRGDYERLLLAILDE